MAFIIGGNRGVGGNVANVPDSMRFANAIDRNDYFNTNPSRLKEDVYVTVAGQLQRYTGQLFENTAVVIEGEKGEPAPPMIVQYSATGNTGWSDTINLALHKYWRWSIDGGVTWSPNFITFSGEGGTGVPAPYSMAVGNNGKLQLFKDGVLIQEQDDTGAWIVNSVSTGTGSIHLGELHSMGSAGENVVFLNEDSQIAWHPSWGGVTTDGLNVFEQTVRNHGDNLLFTEPSGFQGVSVVGYNSTFTTIGNDVFFFFRIIPAEDYNGGVVLRVTNQVTGTEVCSFIMQIAATNTIQLDVPLKYPLWLPIDHNYSVSITKEDGQLLQVISSVGGVEPWFQAISREYSDHAILHEGNPEMAVAAISTLQGADRLPASAIRDMPVMSGTIAGIAKLGTTMSIDGAGVLNTAISPTGIKIVADEVSRLAIPVSGGAILAIQQDSGFTYGIEAGDDTSVVGNWKQIGTVATDVVSFNGRNGAVVPANGDYNMDQVNLADQTTAAKYVFRVNNGVPYIEEIA